jgi:hypothetical protein
MPAQPDFSLPVPSQWREAARSRLGRFTKPLMVYRPLVLNNLFHCEQRCQTSTLTPRCSRASATRLPRGQRPTLATTASTSLGQRCQRTPNFITANCRSRNLLVVRGSRPRLHVRGLRPRSSAGRRHAHASSFTGGTRASRPPTSSVRTLAPTLPSSHQPV